MAVTIEELVVKLRADTVQLRRGMSQAVQTTDTAVNRMESGFQRMGNRLAAAARSVFTFRNALVAVAGVSGLGLLVRRSIDAADQVGKVADKVGLTTDALQELRFAADQAGVNTATLDMAMQRFSRRVGEAVNGGGELKDTLDLYGIAVRDAAGNTRDLDDILTDLADAIAGAGSQQERLAIAFKAFDSEGAALVNLLRDGGVALEAFRQKARDFGAVLEGSLIRESEEAKNELAALETQIGANTTRLAVNFAPVLVTATELLAKFSENIIRGRSELRKFLLDLPSGSLLQADALGEGETPEERNIVSQRKQREREEVLERILELERKIRAERAKDTDANPQTATSLAFIAELEPQLEAARKKLQQLNRELITIDPIPDVTADADEAISNIRRVADASISAQAAIAAAAMDPFRGDEDATAARDKLSLEIQVLQLRMRGLDIDARRLELEAEFADENEEVRDVLIEQTLKREELQRALETQLALQAEAKALAEAEAEAYKKAVDARLELANTTDTLPTAGDGPVIASADDQPASLQAMPDQIALRQQLTKEVDVSAEAFKAAEAAAQELLEAQISGETELIELLKIKQQFPFASDEEIEKMVAARMETERLSEVLSDQQKTMKNLEAAAQEFAQEFSKAIADALLDSERNFEDFKDAVLRMMFEIATQRFVTEPLKEGLNSLFDVVAGGISGALSGGFNFGGGVPAPSAASSGNIFHSVFAGTRAEGGRIRSGSFALVGEEGPELAFASSRGTDIVPLTGTSLQPTRGRGMEIEMLQMQQFETAMARAADMMATQMPEPVAQPTQASDMEMPEIEVDVPMAQIDPDQLSRIESFEPPPVDINPDQLRSLEAFAPPDAEINADQLRQLETFTPEPAGIDEEQLRRLEAFAPEPAGIDEDQLRRLETIELPQADINADQLARLENFQAPPVEIDARQLRQLESFEPDPATIDPEQLRVIEGFDAEPIEIDQAQLARLENFDPGVADINPDQLRQLESFEPGVAEVDPDQLRRLETFDIGMAEIDPEQLRELSSFVPPPAEIDPEQIRRLEAFTPPPAQIDPGQLRMLADFAPEMPEIGDDQIQRIDTAIAGAMENLPDQLASASDASQPINVDVTQQASQAAAPIEFEPMQGFGQAPPAPSIDIAAPEMPEPPSVDIAAPEMPELPSIDIAAPDIPPPPAIDIAAPELPAPSIEVAAPEMPSLPSLEIEPMQMPQIEMPEPRGMDVGAIQAPRIDAPEVSAASQSITIHQSFDFRNTDAGTANRLERIAKSIQAGTIAEVERRAKQGGSFAKSIGKR